MKTAYKLLKVFRPLTIVLLLFTACFSQKSNAVFLEDYPHLNQYIFEEDDTGFHFGVGVSPVGFIDSHWTVGINFFQLHYMTENWDIELINTSIQLKRAKNFFSRSRHFVIRSGPKYRINKTLSIGAVVGMEFVEFPNVQTRLTNGFLFTEFDEPFSNIGAIYGIMASQVFHPWKEMSLRVNQVIYKQSYSALKTHKGWDFFFQEPSINADTSKDLIKPGVVILFEFSLMY
jgi:hypothetical protein